MTQTKHHRSNLKIRARRRRRKRITFIILLSILFVLSIFFLKKTASILTDIFKPETNTSDMNIPANADLNTYPKYLLELMDKNPETSDFVLDYPALKDSPPVDSIGTVTKGEIPLLLQWDKRWGYTPYGDDIIALSGCGPTVLSMVASGLTGDDTITPAKIAKYAQENGYYVSGIGTSWNLIYSGCQNFGISAQELTLSENVMKKELEKGHPIICSMRPGDFTTSGHFIVLTEYKNKSFKVHDPNSKKRSRQLWSFNQLEGQINNLWSFSAI